MRYIIIIVAIACLLYGALAWSGNFDTSIPFEQWSAEKQTALLITAGAIGILGVATIFLMSLGDFFTKVGMLRGKDLEDRRGNESIFLVMLLFGVAGFVYVIVRWGW